MFKFSCWDFIAVLFLNVITFLNVFILESFQRSSQDICSENLGISKQMPVVELYFSKVAVGRPDWRLVKRNYNSNFFLEIIQKLKFLTNVANDKNSEIFVCRLV